MMREHKERRAGKAGMEKKNIFQKTLTGGPSVPHSASLPGYRNEWKYYLSYWECEALRQRFNTLMERDPHAVHGTYMIRSLYFDDYWNSAYNEKMAGVNYRKKYRIRIYDYSDRQIKLERKIKVDNYIHKDSASITRQEFEWILEGKYDFLLHHEKQLCREFYFECVSNVMRPKVIVDYEREPFVLKEGDVRVTFDSHVRAAILTNDIFDPLLPAYDTLPPDRVVMEVKFTEFLPQFIKEALPPGGQEFSAISKYTLCYEQVYYRTEALFMVTRSEKWS